MRTTLSKFSWLIVAALLGTTIWISCSKKDAKPNSSSKGSHGLSHDEVKYLEKKYPGLKIKEPTTGKEGTKHFNSLTEVEETIEGVEAYISETFSFPAGAITNEVELLVPESPGAPCGGYGTYTTSTSAGLFSSFKINFTWGSGGLSNITTSVSGLRIGWNWEHSGSQILYPNMACADGVAHFSDGGILNWDIDVHITFAFDPTTCNVIASTGSGKCSSRTPSSGVHELILINLGSNLLPTPLPSSILPVTDLNALKNNLPQSGSYISIYFNSADSKYYSDSGFTTFVPDGYYQNSTTTDLIYHHIVNGVAIDVYMLL